MEPDRKIYEDYKYVLQDVGTVGIGAKFNYYELEHDEDVPFKIKLIAEKYLSSEIDKSTTLESQIYYMTRESFAYECFLQLKTKVKFSRQIVRKRMFGGEKKIYKTEILPLNKFVEIPLETKKESGIMIQEIVFSKMSIMTFSV